MILVDGSNLLHRIVSIKDLLSQKDDKGFSVGCASTFINSLNKIATKTDYTESILVAWDSGVPKHRREIFSEYKPSKSDDALKSSYKKKSDDYLKTYGELRDCFHNYLPLIGIASIRIANCEADDIIANICLAKLEDIDFKIYSADRDFHQLLNGHRVVQYDDRSGKIITDEDVIRDNDYDPKNWKIEWKYAKSINGDKADGIPGIEGMGEVNASRYAKVIVKELLNTNKTVKEVLVDLKKLDGSTQKGFNNLVSDEGLKIQHRNYNLIDLSYLRKHNEELLHEIFRGLANINHYSPDFHSFSSKFLDKYKLDDKAITSAFELTSCYNEDELKRIGKINVE